MVRQATVRRAAIVRVVMAIVVVVAVAVAAIAARAVNAPMDRRKTRSNRYFFEPQYSGRSVTGAAVCFQATGVSSVSATPELQLELLVGDNSIPASTTTLTQMTI